MSAVDELKSRMRQRIAESEQELALLRDALDAYDRASTPPAAARTRSRRRTRRQTASAVTSPPSQERPPVNAEPPAAESATPARGDGADASTEPRTPTRRRGARAAGGAAATPAGTASTSTTSGAVSAPAPSRARSRELQSSQITELLAESPNGLSIVALARRAGASESAVRERLTELERTGRVRSSGSRRTSLWRMLSDEEWVAERAAQLSQSSGGGSPT